MLRSGDRVIPSRAVAEAAERGAPRKQRHSQINKLLTRTQEVLFSVPELFCGTWRRVGYADEVVALLSSRGCERPGRDSNPQPLAPEANALSS